MRKPKPPFLEFNFFFSDENEENSFLKLLTTLMELGTELVGTARVHQVDNVKYRKFAGISDKPLKTIAFNSLADVEQIVHREDIRLIQLDLLNATTVAKDIIEILTYVSISKKASEIDNHPLAIWTEGIWTEWANYNGNLRKNYEEQARISGKKAYKRFLHLVKQLRPAYAAITVEWPLECPTDLRLDPRSLAFTNFFISSDYVGVSNLNSIRDLFTKAYIEPIANGLYISCWEFLNPDQKNDNSEKGIDIAKIITSSNGF